MSNQPPIDRLHQLAEVRDATLAAFDQWADKVGDTLETLRNLDLHRRPGESDADAIARLAFPVLQAATDADPPAVELLKAVRAIHLDAAAVLLLAIDELPKADKGRLRGLRPAGQPVIARADELRQPQKTKRRERVSQ